MSFVKALSQVNLEETSHAYVYEIFRRKGGAARFKAYKGKADWFPCEFSTSEDGKGLGTYRKLSLSEIVCKMQATVAKRTASFQDKTIEAEMEKEIREVIEDGWMLSASDRMSKKLEKALCSDFGDIQNASALLKMMSEKSHERIKKIEGIWSWMMRLIYSWLYDKSAQIEKIRLDVEVLKRPMADATEKAKTKAFEILQNKISQEVNKYIYYVNGEYQSKSMRDGSIFQFEKLDCGVIREKIQEMQNSNWRDKFRYREEQSTSSDSQWISDERIIETVEMFCEKALRYAKLAKQCGLEDRLLTQVI